MYEKTLHRFGAGSFLSGGKLGGFLLEDFDEHYYCGGCQDHFGDDLCVGQAVQGEQPVQQEQRRRP